MVNQIYIFWSERLGTPNFGWLIEPFLFDKKEYKRKHIQDINEAFKSFEISAIVDYKTNGRPGDVFVPWHLTFPNFRYYMDMKSFRKTSPQDQWMKFPDEETLDDWRASNEYIKRFQHKYFGYLSREQDMLFCKEDLSKDGITFYTHVPTKPRRLLTVEEATFYRLPTHLECACGAKIETLKKSRVDRHWYGKSTKHLMWKHEHGYRRMLKQAKREEWENTPTIQQYDKGLRTDFIELEF